MRDDRPRVLLVTPVPSGPRSRTRRSPHFLAPLWAAAWFGCAPAPPELPTLTIGAPIRVGERIRELDFTLEDELGVTFVADLIATPSGYALADTGGWVLLLDGELGLRHRFGGVGSGPAELRLPQDLEELSDGRVAIFDSGNNRITVMDDEGELVATVRAGEGPLTDFAALGSGSMFVVGSPGPRSLVRLLPDPDPSFGRIPKHLWAEIDAPSSAPTLGTHLAADDAGRVHHFDEQSNAVFTYSPNGSLERLLTLPPGILEKIRDQAAEMDQSFGGRAVLGHTWMLGLGTFADRAVLSGTPPGVEGLGLVLSGDGTEALPIVPAPSLPAPEFHHVVRILLEEDRITTVRPDGLFQYRIEWPDGRNRQGRVGSPRVRDPRRGAPRPLLRRAPS